MKQNERAVVLLMKQKERKGRCLDIFWLPDKVLGESSVPCLELTVEIHDI